MTLHDRNLTNKTFGEQLQALSRAADNPAAISAANGVTVTGPAATLEDGASLVAPTIAQELIASVYEEAAIAPLCDRRRSERLVGETRVPTTNEKSRATGSRWGGAVAYWAEESESAPTSYPKFGSTNFRPKKLSAICVASDELIEDAPMLEAHLRRAFAAEMAFKLDEAILAGAGTGTPLGIINSSALITVPKETGQPAATLQKENVDAMWSRMAAPCRKRTVWLANEDALSALERDAMNYGGIFIPTGNAGNAAPLLKGRPVVEVEQAPALGAVGDIVLADLSQYIVVDSDPRVTVSIDTHFTSGETAFRFTMSVDGAPAWNSPITPFNASATRSPFVTLAAR